MDPNRSSRWLVFFKIDVLKNSTIFTGKHLCWRLFLTKSLVFRPATLLKETPTQVFSWGHCEIYKNSIFVEHLWRLLLTKVNYKKHEYSINLFLSVVFYIDAEQSEANLGHFQTSMMKLFGKNHHQRYLVALFITLTHFNPALRFI